MKDITMFDEKKSYIVKFRPIENYKEYFQLLNEEDDVLLHISFHEESDVIILNKKIDNMWQEEIIIDFPLQYFDAPYLKLKTEKNHIDIFVNNFFIYRKNVDFKSLTIKSSAVSIEETVDDESKNNTIEYMGLEITIPDKYCNDILQDFNTLDNRFQDFFNTRVFQKNSVILEQDSKTHIMTIVFGLLFPHYNIIPVFNDEQEYAMFKEIYTHNELDNIIFLQNSLYAFENMEEYLKMYKMLQTDTIDEFIIVGKNLYLNSPIQEVHQFLLREGKTLSVCSTEDSPPEGNKVFFDSFVINQNIQINISNTDFQLNQHRYGSYSKQKPGLDVVVAMYNTPDYIIACVESILCEGREDIRVILVNDGSTDNSSEVVKKYFGSNKLVKIVDKLNGGCASARNMGYMLSESTHITFFDSDDFVDKNFFSKLFDLAIYSGSEIVQGGFDFYHEDAENKFINSYEDELFKNYNSQMFLEEKVITVPSEDLLLGQPTIWRRVYRRNFLDTKKITFPENIRAYDDYIFHLLTIYYARDVLTMTDIKVHYRQHDGQDIKKGDERHFNELYMFRMILRRSVDEGWPDFSIFSASMVNTVNWSLSILRDDLIYPFMEASVNIFIAIEKVHGKEVFYRMRLENIEHPDFIYLYNKANQELLDMHDGHHWSYFINLYDNPVTLKFSRALARPLA